MTSSTLDEHIRDISEVGEVDDVAFGGVCGSVLSGLAEVDRALTDLLQCKDLLFEHKAIPTNVMLHIAIVVSGMYRSCMELRSPLAELVRLVRLHSQTWDRKSEALADILEEHRRARSELAIALQRLEQTAANEVRFKELRLQNRWVRLFIKANALWRQGDRWRYLMAGFKHALVAGVVLPEVLSDPDDNSEDENDNSGHGLLPCKARVRQKNVNAAGRGPAKNPTMLALEEENTRLQSQIQNLQSQMQGLQDRLSVVTAPKLYSNVSVQTMPQTGTAAATAPGPNAQQASGVRALDRLRAAVGMPAAGSALCVRVHSITGFAGFIPADLHCNLTVVAAISGMYKDLAGTACAARPYNQRDAMLFQEDLVLRNYDADDSIHFALQEGMSGSVLATGEVPFYVFARSANGSILETPTLKDNRSTISINTATYSTLTVTLTPTDSFHDFCRDASGGQQKDVVVHELRLQVTGAVVPPGTLVIPPPPREENNTPTVVAPTRRKSKCVEKTLRNGYTEFLH